MMKTDSSMKYQLVNSQWNIHGRAGSHHVNYVNFLAFLPCLTFWCGSSLQLQTELVNYKQLQIAILF